MGRDTVTSFRLEPRGPFHLSASADFAGGFAPGLGGGRVGDGDDGASILMAFPLEGWRTSAAVDLRQERDGAVVGEVYGAETLSDSEAGQAQEQALRSLSLDRDGTGWAAVGGRDMVIGTLQRRYAWIRPVCFYSAYESATSFVIGQRISMRQGARVKAWLGETLGDAIALPNGETVRAFPRPQRLLEAKSVPGISEEKVRRLHGLARAALDGALNTAELAALPHEEALSRLQSLPGVGAWTAQAILMRGCGVPDAIPSEDAISREAVRHFYGFGGPLTDQEWKRVSDEWRPYRMWATVLLHMAWRREQPGTPSYRQK